MRGPAWTYILSKYTSLKNKLHTYLSTSDKYVAMPLGMASSAGAFDWDSNKLTDLKRFLKEGFAEKSFD